MRGGLGLLLSVGLACAEALAGGVAWADGAARRHYEDATAAYNIGEYGRAALEYTEAYKLVHDAALLYDIAQAYRLAGDPAQSLWFYRSFLRAGAPDRTTREQVEAQIAKLQQQLAQSPVEAGPQLPAGLSAEDPDTEQARRHFQAGASFYRQERYTEAIGEFEQARKIKERPALDYNIARAHDRLGNLDGALAAYRRYLKTVPEPQDAAEIRSRIQTLESRKALLVPPPPPPVAPPMIAPAANPPASKPPARVDRRAGSKKKIAGVVIGAVGVAALVGGATMEALAKRAGDDLTRANAAGHALDKSEYAAGRAEDAAGTALLVVGGAAVLTGVVLAVVGLREAKAARVTVAPFGSRTSAGFAVEVGW
jgi:tetratricopeptide (TPR) repeat protein